MVKSMATLDKLAEEANKKHPTPPLPHMNVKDNERTREHNNRFETIISNQLKYARAKAQATPAKAE